MDAAGVFHFIFHIVFFFFLERVALPSDQTRLLLLSNGDEAGGGHRFCAAGHINNTVGEFSCPFFPPALS